MQVEVKHFLGIIMARLKNIVFGFPVGKAGDIIFKVRGGKPYFSLRPIRFRRKDEDRFRKIKEDFSFAARLSSAVYRVKVFRTAWENFNKLMKSNYQNIKGSASIDNVILVPCLESLKLTLKSFQFNDNKIEADVELTGRQYPYGTMISLQGILHLTNPADCCLEKHFFIPVISKDYDFSNAPVEIKIYFSAQDTEIIKKYYSGKILLNAAVKELCSGKVQFTNRIAAQL
jgi:hypothetical protein